LNICFQDYFEYYGIYHTLISVKTHKNKSSNNILINFIITWYHANDGKLFDTSTQGGQIVPKHVVQKTNNFQEHNGLDMALEKEMLSTNLDIEALYFVTHDTFETIMTDCLIGPPYSPKQMQL